MDKFQPLAKRWAGTPSLTSLAVAPRRFAPVVSQFLTPLALTSYVLAFWRLSSDLDWTGEFFVSQGLLSRWQVWLAIGIATQILRREIDRASKQSGDRSAP